MGLGGDGDRTGLSQGWWLPGSGQAGAVRFQHQLLQLLLSQRVTGLRSSIHLEKVGGWLGKPCPRWSPRGQGSTQSISQRGQHPCLL